MDKVRCAAAIGGPETGNYDLGGGKRQRLLRQRALLPPVRIERHEGGERHAPQVIHVPAGMPVAAQMPPHPRGQPTRAPGAPGVEIEAAREVEAPQRPHPQAAGGGEPEAEEVEPPLPRESDRFHSHPPIHVSATPKSETAKPATSIQ